VRIETPSEPIDWERIDHYLAHEHGLRLYEIEDMTFSEMAIYLDKGEARPAGNPGIPMGSEAEMAAYARGFRQDTPRQKLHQARRNRDGR
jgi:hypothetical protein